MHSYLLSGVHLDSSQHCEDCITIWKYLGHHKTSCIPSFVLPCVSTTEITFAFVTASALSARSPQGRMHQSDIAPRAQSRTVSFVDPISKLAFILPCPPSLTTTTGCGQKTHSAFSNYSISFVQDVSSPTSQICLLPHQSGFQMCSHPQCPPLFFSRPPRLRTCLW